jgi:predicted nucleotidyltransferase
MGSVQAGTAAGCASSGTLDALFSRSLQRVLALVFGQPERELTQAEIIALASSGSGAVQRALAALVRSGLVRCTTQGRSKLYAANPAAPIFEELQSIVEKTSGVPAVLRAALEPIAPGINLALVYGSVAKGTDRAQSDIDVLVVSDDLLLEQVFAALAGAERRLGRHVSPTLYTRGEFLRRRREGHAFLKKVLAGKHVILIGSEDALGASR